MNFRRFVAVVVVLSVGAAAVAWVFIGSAPRDSAVGIANVVGGVAAVLALLVVLFPLRPTGAHMPDTPALSAQRTRATVEYLAAETLRFWQKQAKDRHITKPGPVTVRWQRAGDDVAPAWPQEGLLTEGTLTHLREHLYERQEGAARVVLLGGPGSGKTTAMLLLLIDILEHRTDQVQPVPLWLTLGGWNPATTPLWDWATTVLRRDYPGTTAPAYGPAAASELIRTGRIALFLDGLDEMPPDLQGHALDTIDRETVGLPVVLTSRPDEYQAALDQGRLYQADVIDVLPVDAEHAATSSSPNSSVQDTAPGSSSSTICTPTPTAWPPAL